MGKGALTAKAPISKQNPPTKKEINAARTGLAWVEKHYGVKPWLMISISDGEAIHFRKAFFNFL